jgi:hypothetical protein
MEDLVHRFKRARSAAVYGVAVFIIIGITFFGDTSFIANGPDGLTAILTRRG